MLDEQGRYELVALPGRGLITVRDDGSRSRPVAVPPGTRGFDERLKAFRTVPAWAMLGNFTAYCEIDLAANSEGVDRDLQTDPGRSLAVQVVGPDGRPVGGTKVKGMSELFLTAPVPQLSGAVPGRQPPTVSQQPVGHDCRVQTHRPLMQC